MSNKNKNSQSKQFQNNRDFTIILGNYNGKLSITIADERSQTSMFFKDSEINEGAANSIVWMCKQLVNRVKNDYQQATIESSEQN